MNIGIFLATASENNDKSKFLYGFDEGISIIGADKHFITKSSIYKECDIAVIFGFYGVNLGEIHKIRKHIYTEHTKRGKQCIFIDADLFRFSGSQKLQINSNVHVRLSFGSIFFNKALHFNENSDSTRWELLKNRKGIELLDYKSDGDYVLICLNSNPYIGKGWSAGDTDMYDWALSTIRKIRRYTDKDIVIRFHPNAKDSDQKNIPIQRFLDISANIKFSGGINIDNDNVINGTTLTDDCVNASACIVHSTSASVTPILCGVPVFTRNKNCPVYNIANHDILSITNPEKINREQWLFDTSYSLWNYEEIKSGIVWERFRKRLNKKGDYSRSAAKKLGILT